MKEVPSEEPNEPAEESSQDFEIVSNGEEEKIQRTKRSRKNKVNNKQRNHSRTTTTNSYFRRESRK
jgi:hypothetical protein